MYRKIIFLVTAGALTACSGTPPSDLGIQGEGLKPCPDKPNCVSSLAPPKDDTHFITALTPASPAALDALWQRLPETLKTLDIRIVELTDAYLRAEATTRVMRFVDDLEFYKDSKSGVIQVRSASRLGYSDLGKNRERLERVREALR